MGYIAGGETAGSNSSALVISINLGISESSWQAGQREGGPQAERMREKHDVLSLRLWEGCACPGNPEYAAPRPLAKQMEGLILSRLSP